MEIEAKFRVDDDLIFQRLPRLGAIGNFRLVAAPRPEDQHNVYFDTADGRLRSQHYGLRVRDLGDRRIATLKGAAQVQDGLYERDEWEVEIGADDQPAAWPPSEARDRALALLEGQALQPIVTVRTLRHHVVAERDDARVAELSLDEGTIEAGGQELRFRELEIELLNPEARADFDALVALLRERFALVPEERSKLQRGLALLNAA
jgi:inorganic triphosphatase YgiF